MRAFRMPRSDWHDCCRTSHDEPETIMSVVRMKSDQPTGHVVAGGMDRAIEKKRLPRWLKLAGGGAVILLLALAWWFAPRGSRQTVQADRLTISEVRKGTFDDFLPL